METKKGNSILVYNDLFSNKDWNAWNTLESFPFENFSDTDEVFSKISALEIVFEGTHGDPEKNERLFEDFESQVTDLLTSILSKKDLYLFVSENTGAKKNRVRSFKGLLPKKELIDTDFLEVEIPLYDDQTIICGMVKVTPKSLGVCFDYLMDNTRCFVIDGDPSCFGEPFLNAVIKECYVHNKGFYLDYSKLLIEYCLRGNMIFRSGGDGGDQEVSFQCFCLKEQKEIIIRELV